MKKHFNKLLCWWFGCEPDFEIKTCADENYYFDMLNKIPCSRCGNADTDLYTRCGGSIHSRFCRFLKNWLWHYWRFDNRFHYFL